MRERAGQTGGRPFGRVLIANRGEIAVRIIGACHEAGMTAVAVFSDADEHALHVRLADDAVRIGPAPAAESYLRMDAIVAAAIASGAEAVHPGYGFLAERADFARAVTDAGLVFIGPAAATIEALGDKIGARQLAQSVGVETVSGTGGAVSVDRPDEVAAILADAERIGYPLLVKAAAGGGGRGMRRIERAKDLVRALTAASAEALAAFGDGAVYLEREIQHARHIEVQLLGDESGRVVAIGERDCSIQRRHQKLVEESPAPGLTDIERLRLHDAAVRVGVAAGLVNAATAEFLRGRDGAFHFLEVNTRLQVEHGVTELVTGLDLVQEQFRIAAGEPLSDPVLAAAAGAREPTRHAIEVRLTAEDPSRDFSPTPGRVGRWVMPSGPGVRVDTGLEGRGPDPTRVRQPDGQDHGGRERPGRGHRRPAPGPGRDRGERGPDDAAIPSVRGETRRVRPGRALDRLGRGDVGRTGRPRPRGGRGGPGRRDVRGPGDGLGPARARAPPRAPC